MWTAAIDLKGLKTATTHATKEEAETFFRRFYPSVVFTKSDPKVLSNFYVARDNGQHVGFIARKGSR